MVVGTRLGWGKTTLSSKNKGELYFIQSIKLDETIFCVDIANRYSTTEKSGVTGGSGKYFTVIYKKVKTVFKNNYKINKIKKGVLPHI